jgi:FkbM family methyltransferase
MNIEWNSQTGGDFFVWLNFINKRVEDGVCLEIGASDGITYSNSLFFERQLGYKCLLIEPFFPMYQELVKNRPDAICVNTGVSNSSEQYQLLVGNEFTAGYISTMAKSHLAKFHSKRVYSKTPNSKMSTVLEKSGITHIDYFSLDVEGGELEVLKSIDWDKVSIYLFGVELDNQNPTKDEAVRHLLREHGFEYRHRIHNDEYWENPTYFRKSLLFDKTLRPDYKGEDLNNYGHHVFLDDTILRRKIGSEIASYYTCS